MREQRLALTAQQQRSAALQVTDHLTALPAYQQAGHIAAYIASNGELNCHFSIVDAWQQRKHVYVPIVLDKQRLSFAPYTAQSLLCLNQYCIPEPVHNAAQQIAAETMDVIIVPVLAFDQYCHRIGMGGGYYDRALATIDTTRTTTIGLAYDLQCIDRITPAAWDIALDIVITPSCVYHRSSIVDK